MKPEYVKAVTTHRRLGPVVNQFRYAVDYALVEPEAAGPVPALFSFNRTNLMSLRDRDHGGPKTQGRGAAWVREMISAMGMPAPQSWRVLLLAQPRLIGPWFSPVSFWFVMDDADALRAVIAEVNNTFGERHNYFCAHADFHPITPDDVLHARKVFHVSPFQPIEGGYRFRFSLTEKAVAIRIAFTHAGGGLIATLAGTRTPLTSARIVGISLRRPFAALRVLALIHWQALKLWVRQAKFHTHPAPPAQEITR